MLKKIEFENYRCFKKNSLTFRDLTIIVGKNNAGKSTIIEALRLISYVCKKCKHTTYVDAPNSLKLPLSSRGFKINVDKFKIDLRGIVYYYSEGNAKVIARFDNGAKIIIILNTDFAFATIYDTENNIIKTKGKAIDLDLDIVDILPQIGLIKENEKLLTLETVLSDIDTYLSSRHFRNELWRNKKELFNDFKQLAETTWSGLRIIDLDYNSSINDFIQLLVEDERFTAEIGLMGSGLQMWLQIIWFICRTKNSKTVILDEPDVYMHPDLQRKILRLLKNRYAQVVIATHSVEIISEVDPKNIVTIDKNSVNMRYSNNIKAVQNIIDSIGSVHNLSLVRLSSAKKCLFVEGKDLKYLSKFHEKMYPKSEISLESLPCIPLGGWSRLSDAFGAAKLFYSETQDAIKSYCILDSDYFSPDQISEKYNLAKENHLHLFVWERKEIENYLLVPKAIFRITQRPESEYTEFLIEFEKIIDGMKLNITDQYANQLYLLSERKKQLPTCNSEARQYIDSKWTNLQNKINLVSGKEMISKTNAFIKEKYNKSCSVHKILQAITLEELDEEVKDVIRQISN
ncbi:ATP-dependent nuclease [Pseudobacteroides cellulosolvens]|uniref:ATPase AAA-type core domain-containing protein n=1 Tax=Pseudobacteroides cellulosolvens ATCC 35603 = DSM 2933 TaxID=398512 RepID=A0A0L6JQ24_9FIRM|nr:ATP-binding protein [Pseudobacteroides cellulosolvens]KNY27941.1 hypothetical protein Bccel_3212 [Pseudobacteroides cellulosolvens ATCC 35603 = DSM 2933]